MIDDVGMRVLRAEHNNLRVLVHSYIVPRGPVEEVICHHALLLARAVCRRETAFNDKSPMRALAQISIQSLKERCRIDPGR